jgi:hypothetical protein
MTIKLETRGNALIAHAMDGDYEVNLGVEGVYSYADIYITKIQAIDLIKHLMHEFKLDVDDLVENRNTAATELYDALEVMLKDYRAARDEWGLDAQDFADGVIEQAEKALAKARGEL